MLPLTRFYSIILIATLFSCSHSGESFDTYKETPKYIKVFLDSINDGKFAMAEKNEEWESGCIASGEKPRHQFVSASLKKDEFIMEYWSGGIATSKIFFTAKVKDNRIIRHSFNR